MKAAARGAPVAHKARDKRPAARRARLSEPREPRPVRRIPGSWTQEAQRRERVVRHLARPHQVPERVEDRFLVAAAAGVVEVAEEARAARFEVLAQALMEVTAWRVIRLPGKAWSVTAQVQRDLSVGRAQRSASDPHHLPHRDQLLQQPRAVTADTGGDDIALDHPPGTSGPPGR